jgi:hypothetical protein
LALQNALKQAIAAADDKHKKWEFNWQQGHGATNKNEFRDEVLCMEAVQCFAMARPETSIITIVHGVRKFFHPNAPAAINGSVFGRIGEWSRDSHPLIVELQKEATWGWEKIKVATSETQWANFCTSPASANGQLWKPAENAANAVEHNVQVPKLLYLPAPVALYAVTGQPKTAISIYNFVSEYASKPESGIAANEADFIKKWLLAAGQTEPGKDRAASSEIVLRPDPVLETATVFTQWANRTLQVYLGQGPTPVAPQAPVVAQPPAMDQALLAQMMTVISKLAENQGEIQSQAKQSRAEDIKLLDDYDQAALKGFCGVDNMGDVPQFWALSRTTKNIDAVRSILLREMNAWAIRNSNEIYESIYFSEDQMKDFIRNNPNPTKGLATLSMATRGVSPLGCLPTSQAEIEERMLREQYANETAENRTYDEAVKLAKSKTVKPPQSYYHFRLMTNTFGALVFVLYGVQCPLYLDLLTIINTLKMPQTKLAYGGFDKEFCARASWALYDCSRRFFFYRLMPEDFRREQINYPVSLLGGLTEDIMFQNDIHRTNFPSAWATTRAPKNTLPLYAGGGGGGGANKIRTTQRQTERENNDEGPEEIRLDHMQPELKKAMAPLHKKFGKKLRFQEVMLAAGIKDWGKLPKLKVALCKDTGRHQLCWNHTCGHCPWGGGCTFSVFHLEGSEIEEGFVDELLTMLQPGIDTMMSTSYKRTSFKRGLETGSAGGPRNKQERR